MSVIDSLELKINEDDLFKILKNETILENDRCSAMTILMDMESERLVAFWERVDFKKDAFWIPWYLSFYSRLDPIKALSIFSQLDQFPDNPESYEMGTKISLSAISKNADLVEKFLILTFQEDWKQKWKQEYLEEILSSYPKLSFLLEEWKSYNTSDS